MAGEAKRRERLMRAHVLGGGVAGLTAAHELVERGFDVTVVEKLARPFEPDQCEIGGLARTQWCGLGAVTQPLGELVRTPALMGAEPAFGEVLVKEIPFGEGRYDLDEAGVKYVGAIAVEVRKARWRWLTSLPIAQRSPRLVVQVLVEGYAQKSEQLPESPQLKPEILAALLRTALIKEHGPALLENNEPIQNLINTMSPWAGKRSTQETREHTLSRFRAVFVAVVMHAKIGKKASREGNFWFVPVGMGGAQRTALSEPKQGKDVRFRLLDILAPGEHGYRYFPGFYRHVFDTMKRTPLFETAGQPRPRDVRSFLEVDGIGGSSNDSDWALDDLITSLSTTESPRTVYDNLVPTHQFAIAPGDGEPPVPVSRVRPRSLLEIRRLLSTSFRRLGMSPADTVRFELKLAQFMTSSSLRRATYERMTWAEFIGSERYSEQFQRLIERWPQALVGLRASVADARTIGTVAIQLLLDQLALNGYRDGTLNGPTTTAWLDPWRRYLEARGVNFERREVKALRWEGDRVNVAWSNSDLWLQSDSSPFSLYIVLAVSPLEAKRLMKTLWESCDDKGRQDFPESFRPLLRWPPEDACDGGGLRLDRTAPVGPLRHYSGIQFYLENDVGPAQGHIYFPGSEWALSAISQAQFWQRRLQRTNGNRGRARYVSVLSVDIGDWHTPADDEESKVRGRIAAECTRNELAAEVWRQIEEGIAHNGWKPPRPFAYHLDDDIVYKRHDGGERPKENRSPYLVNLKGDWDNHPGTEKGYKSEIFEGLVIAGAYVKTRTRLTTMESANESARRAVNAILDDYRERHPGQVPDRCQLWDPEENEIDDLDFLKEIDEELMKKGLPHLFEILDLERLLDGGLDVLAPDEILDALTTRLGGIPAGLPVRLIRKTLEALFG